MNINIQRTEYWPVLACRRLTRKLMLVSNEESVPLPLKQLMTTFKYILFCFFYLNEIKFNLDKHLRIKIRDRSFAQSFDVAMKTMSWRHRSVVQNSYYSKLFIFLNVFLFKHFLCDPFKTDTGVSHMIFKGFSGFPW